MQGGCRWISYDDMTFGVSETRVLLAMLNDGLISDEVLEKLLSTIQSKILKMLLNLYI